MNLPQLQLASLLSFILSIRVPVTVKKKKSIATQSGLVGPGAREQVNGRDGSAGTNCIRSDESVLN